MPDGILSDPQVQDYLPPPETDGEICHVCGSFSIAGDVTGTLYCVMCGAKIDSFWERQA
jgi:hypothetical protein